MTGTGGRWASGIAAVAAVLGVWTAAPAAPSDAAAASAFAADPLWDDGKAEVSLYRAEEPRYGQVRRFEARLIVVKEDFKRNALVKSDDGPVPGETFPVLKLNHVRLIPTGTYDYHQMLSVFLDRSAFRPVKLAMAHFESCGITFVEAIPSGDQLVLTSHSYWDGEGDRVVKIPFAGADTLYDALPLQLRGLDFSDPSERKMRILPTQISGKVRNLSLVEVTIRVAGREKLEVPAGKFEATRIEVERPEGKDRFFFETAPPHRLLRLDTPEGSHYLLRRSIRLDYWNHHGAGDEKLLE